MIRDVVILLACWAAAMAQSQPSKNRCLTQSAEVEKLKKWVNYDRVAKSSNLTINMSKLATATSLLEQCRSGALAGSEGSSGAKTIGSDANRSSYSPYMSQVQMYIPPSYAADNGAEDAGAEDA